MLLTNKWFNSEQKASWLIPGVTINIISEYDKEKNHMKMITGVRPCVL